MPSNDIAMSKKESKNTDFFREAIEEGIQAGVGGLASRETVRGILDNFSKSLKDAIDHKYNTCSIVSVVTPDDFSESKVVIRAFGKSTPVFTVVFSNVCYPLEFRYRSIVVIVDNQKELVSTIKTFCKDRLYEISEIINRWKNKND